MEAQYSRLLGQRYYQLYDGRLKLRVYPSKTSTSLLTAAVFICSLYSKLYRNSQPDERDKFNSIIPNTLERLARQEKLFVEITGTISEPVVDIEKLREEIRRNMPEMTQKFNKIIGPGGILKLFLKDVQSDSLKDILGMNGQNNSLKSGSSLGDILKLIK